MKGTYSSKQRKYQSQKRKAKRLKDEKMSHAHHSLHKNTIYMQNDKQCLFSFF